MRPTMLAAATALALVHSLAPAAETISYSYDALGRLVEVAHSGTVNDGVTSAYSFDANGNRTSRVVSAAAGPPSFAINDVTAIEGDALTFMVSRIGTATTNFSVNWATASGTATPGVDYTTASGTLTFASADTGKTVSIPTLTDSAVESAETIVVNLTNASGGATIADAQGIGTITNLATNSPPVTQADYVQIGCNVSTTVNVTANDSDPEGNTPLTVTAVTSDGLATATVVSGSSIRVTGAPENEEAVATYTVKDSLNAVSTGTLSIDSVGGPSICDV